MSAISLPAKPNSLTSFIRLPIIKSKVLACLGTTTSTSPKPKSTFCLFNPAKNSSGDKSAASLPVPRYCKNCIDSL